MCNLSVIFQPCVLLNNVQQLRIQLERMFESMGAKQVSLKSRVWMKRQNEYSMASYSMDDSIQYFAVSVLPII